MAEIKGKTKSGFEYSISSNVADDYRVVKAIARIEGDDEIEGIKGAVELVGLLLGKEGAERLERHVALEDGTVPTSKMMDELTEILSALGRDDDTKNL